MEELIEQFKLVTEGRKPPVGEVYVAVEGGNGEIGFFLVSDGTGKPYKCRARSPSFSNTQSLSPHDRGRDARRHRPDVRHDQHDRGRV